MNLDIRPMSGHEVTEAFLETLTGLADVGLTVRQAREIFRQRLRAGVLTYVALLEGRVVGTATLLVEQKFIHAGGRVGHVEDVAIHPQFQRRGIGLALVRHLTGEAQKLGCYKVILSCFEDRVPFYQNLGFRPHDVGMRLDLREDGHTCASASSATPTAVTPPLNGCSIFSQNGG